MKSFCSFPLGARLFFSRGLFVILCVAIVGLASRVSIHASEQPLAKGAVISRVVCIDLHSAQIQSFFDIPVDHLYARPVLLDYLRQQTWAHDIVVVSPDVGRTKMSRGFASRLNASLAIIEAEHGNMLRVANALGVLAERLSAAPTAEDLHTVALIAATGFACAALRSLLDALAMPASPLRARQASHS